MKVSSASMNHIQNIVLRHVTIVDCVVYVTIQVVVKHQDHLFNLTVQMVLLLKMDTRPYSIVQPIVIQIILFMF